MIEERREIEALFLEAFIEELNDYPEHYEILYGVPINKIKADPEYYYNLEPEGAGFDYRQNITDRASENHPAKGPELARAKSNHKSSITKTKTVKGKKKGGIQGFL